MCLALSLNLSFICVWFTKCRLHMVFNSYVKVSLSWLNSLPVFTILVYNLRIIVWVSRRLSFLNTFLSVNFAVSRNTSFWRPFWHSNNKKSANNLKHTQKRRNICVCVCVCMFMWFMRTQICIMTWVWHRYYKEKVIYEDIFSVPII